MLNLFATNRPSAYNSQKRINQNEFTRNETWPLKLSHVNQLGKYIRVVIYLLVVVDCVARSFRVEPLKKQSNEAATGSRKLIKHK